MVQGVGANGRRMLPGLGGKGQSASTGLYSLSNHFRTLGDSLETQVPEADNSIDILGVKPVSEAISWVNNCWVSIKCIGDAIKYK